VGIRRILGPWNKPEAIPRNRRWIPNEIEAAIFRVDIPVIFQIPIKTPVFGRKTGVFFYLTLHSLPSKTYCEAHSGRFSGLRIVLLLAPSHPELVEG
jgi:hypothetical protein